MAKIRCEKNPEQFNRQKWKEGLSSTINNCADSILDESMAYGDDPSQVEAIVQAKMKKDYSSSNTSENRDPVDTSVDNIIDPLKKLRGKLCRPSPRDLFYAVLAVDEKEINVSFFICYQITKIKRESFEIFIEKS